MLADATATPEDTGISWSGRKKCPQDSSRCFIIINDICLWLIGTFDAWFVLAIYLDNLIPNANGVRKSIFYFLEPGYWTGKGRNKVKEGGICSCMSSVPHQQYIPPDDEGVLEEENTVKQDAQKGRVDPLVTFQMRGLVKTFAGTRKIGCCKCKKTAPYHLLKFCVERQYENIKGVDHIILFNMLVPPFLPHLQGLWKNFTKDQLFCLLGPNGAGKTTATNCLTGITQVTGGDALIYGYSIRSSVGMSSIRRLVGVCPQFDILWDTLPGQEHLHLFAGIKGLPPASIKSIAKDSLANVRLTEEGKVRTRSYSGGMRRRLSVPIALIGDPKFVILDEPTTGMDPISRRNVWDIIQNAKKGRAVILITHSMEEADVLSDRIGIMTKGRLRHIGTSIRLKSRFGTGFVTNVSFTDVHDGQSPPTMPIDPAVQHDPVKQFFKKHLDVVPAEETKSFLTFVIPHDREKLLTEFFAELQDMQREFSIADIQLGLTTLEEVFLNIARQAELESATAEGILATLTLTSRDSVQGARLIGIPGTESQENPRGVMVEVYWEQDNTGALCISGHSAEMPLPPSAQPLVSVPSASSRRTLGRRKRPVHGIVIDPAHIPGSSSRRQNPF